MKALHRIVAGTDFSSAAQSAVLRAAMLAAEHSAELHVVHVAPRLDIDAIARFGLGGPPETGPGPELERQLAATEELARAHSPTSAVTLAKGGPAATLTTEAERFGADLVVVGSRGERSLKDALIGSTVERLMERWPRDILVVREAPTSAYHTVLACVALGPHSRNVVWSADALSRHARSYLFHAYAPPFEATVVGHAPNADAVASYRDETRRRAEKAVSELLDSCEVGRQFVTVLRYGSPAALIRRAVVRLQVDVAVLGRSQSAVDELLLGSVTKKVVRNVPCDVLIAGLHAASGA